MKTIVVVLLVLGFVIPLVAAGYAFVRFRKVEPVMKGKELTLGEADVLLNVVIPQMIEDQAKAVGWPALWVIFGLALSTVGGIMSLWAT